ncbi:unnamed protein product [Rotaria magnacalcarata]
MKSAFSQNCKRLGCSDHYLNKQLQHTFTKLVIDGDNANCHLAQEMKKNVMTDNEPTMKSAFSQNCKRLGCSDHYLNKQLQHTFTKLVIDGDNANCHLAQEVFGSVKQIVSNIRRMHKQQKLSKK